MSFWLARRSRITNDLAQAGCGSTVNAEYSSVISVPASGWRMRFTPSPCVCTSLLCYMPASSARTRSLLGSGADRLPGVAH